MNKIFNVAKVLVLALALSFGLSYVYAWTAPTVNPPNGNISAPINTSSTAQVKTGALTVGGLTSTGDVCITGKCLSTVSAGAGDNLGNHTATADLLMNSHTISYTSTGWALVSYDGPVYAPYFMASGAGIGAAGVGLILPAGAGAGKVLTSNASGYGSWQVPTGVTGLTAGTGITLNPVGPGATGVVTVSAAGNSVVLSSAMPAFFAGHNAKGSGCAYAALGGIVVAADGRSFSIPGSTFTNVAITGDYSVSSAYRFIFSSTGVTMYSGATLYTYCSWVS